jgi:hypothetical protein
MLAGLAETDPSEFLVYDSKTNLLVDSLKFDDSDVRCSSSQNSNGCSTLLFKGRNKEYVVLYRHNVDKKTVLNDSIK